MKKGLYIAFECLEDSTSGVSKKINMQVKALNELGFEVSAIGAGITDWTKDRLARLLPFYTRESIRRNQQTLDRLSLCDYAFIYIRYPMAGYDLIQMLKKIKLQNSKLKIIVEFPTFPYKKECTRINMKLRLIRDQFSRNSLKKYVDYCTTFSDDEEIYGIPTIKISNGIDMDRIKGRNVPQYKYKKNDTIQLLVVALITRTHGIDKLLKGMSNYYLGGGKRNIILNIVGEGSALRELKKLTEVLELSNNVIFHGFLSGEALEEQYNIAHLGIGTLAAYRVGITEKISSLKTREYCASGLPFIALDIDTVFSNSNFDFATYVTNDESPVEVSKVINFIDELYVRYEYDDIVFAMREYARLNLTWNKCLIPVTDLLEKL